MLHPMWVWRCWCGPFQPTCFFVDKKFLVNHTKHVNEMWRNIYLYLSLKQISIMCANVHALSIELCHTNVMLLYHILFSQFPFNSFLIFHIWWLQIFKSHQQPGSKHAPWESRGLTFSLRVFPANQSAAIRISLSRARKFEIAILSSLLCGYDTIYVYGVIFARILFRSDPLTAVHCAWWCRPNLYNVWYLGGAL